MGLNSSKKKIEKILRKKDLEDVNFIDFIFDNLHNSDIDKLISYIKITKSLTTGNIVSKINSLSSTNNKLKLTSTYRVRKFRKNTKKVNLQLLCDKKIKERFDNLKKEHSLTSEELLNKLLSFPTDI